MGVPIGEATGDHIVLAHCSECKARFELDETMANDCPECGIPNPAVIDGGDPSGWR
jgi:Zn finger protein HypA/HybF involved in hydrogenase expression